MPRRHLALSLLSGEGVVRSLESVFKDDAEGFGHEEAHRARFAGMDGHAPVRTNVDQAGHEEGDQDTAVAVQESVFVEMKESCHQARYAFECDAKVLMPENARNMISLDVAEKTTKEGIFTPRTVVSSTARSKAQTTEARLRAH